MIPPPKPDYTSFLLRLWRDAGPKRGDRAGDEGWLVQIEHIPSGEKRYFASLEDCFAFIRAHATGVWAKPGEER